MKPPHSSHRARHQANRETDRAPIERPDRQPRPPRPPLDRASLDALAVHYVGRFATSRRKLRDYLGRKLRERGWDGEAPADLDAIADRLATLGYIDDAAFATAKARAMSGRGLGGRRVAQALHGAGIGEEDAEPARALVDEERIAAAVRLARRRRIGPFATAALDPAQRDKAIAAMIRGGHGFALARAIVALCPGEEIDLEQLADVR